MYRSDPEAGKLLFQIMIEILSRISTPLVRKPPLEIGPSHELTSSIYDSGGNTWQANDMILEELHDGHVMMHQIDARVDDSVGPCMDWLSSPLGEL